MSGCVRAAVPSGKIMSHPPAVIDTLAARDALAAATRVVAEELAQIEDKLRHLCDGSDDPLCRAAREAIEAGGKRLRPLLTVLCACVGGEPTDITRKVAIASEIMHLASLMHDDVVDEAPLRRGRPSVRAKSGDRMAVLVGDFLAARAYYELSHLSAAEYLEPFADTAMRMCRAEARASQHSVETITEAECLCIARDKTAALFGACCRVGALSAGASDALALSLRDYGEDLGLAFQLTDDLLDLYGSPDVTGKEPGRDAMTGQLTLPIVHALHSPAGDRVRRLLASLSNDGADRATVLELAQVVAEAGGRAAAEELARKHSALAAERLSQAEALTAANSSPDPRAPRRAEALVALRLLCRYVTARAS